MVMFVNPIAVVERIKEVGMISERIRVKVRPSSPVWYIRILPKFDVGVIVIGSQEKCVGDYWIDQKIKAEFGYSNALLLFLFNMFHEIGHYYGKKEGVKNSEIDDMLSRYFEERSLTHEEAMMVEKWYRNLPTEKYADEFALKQIREFFKREKERRDLGCQQR